MVDVTNPYAAPKSELGEPEERRFYTAGQVFLAAVLAGPLAGGYLVSRNHSVFGSPQQAKLTLALSFVALVCMIALGYVLPGNSIGYGLAIAVAVSYRAYATKCIKEAIDERQQSGWARYSWWRVVGISAAVLALMFGVIIAAVVVFPTLRT